MHYTGPVRVITDAGDIGEARVDLTDEVDERFDAGWGGRVLNSDYLLWGLSGKRVRLRLPDGSEVECAVRPAGRLVGLSPPPWSA
ncbi:MAG: hypothetical protein ACR2QE_08090 [Acidimicrobiales bacterium]